MPRPKRTRKVKCIPAIKGLKPIGIPGNQTDKLFMLLEEYESIKLADYENLSHEEAAKLMEISRPTFTRIYDHARKIVARALVEGKSFIIAGGNVDFDLRDYKCKKCGFSFRETGESETILEKNCPECQSEQIEDLNKKFLR